MNPQDHSTCPPSNSESATATEPRRGAGRHPVLDEARQQKILAILTAGGSRRTAARYVGCAPGTITQTAQRAPAFAEQLAHAEQSAEILMLRLPPRPSRPGPSDSQFLNTRPPDGAKLRPASRAQVPTYPRLAPAPRFATESDNVEGVQKLARPSEL